MFNDYVKFQIFPLAILISSPLFSLKSSCYAYQETPFVVAFSNVDYLRFGNIKFNDNSLIL